MMRVRLAIAWLCFAAVGYHYQGWILTAFAALCTYWVLWKRDPDSPFALVAWPWWYMTGLVAVAALLHAAIYLEPWGLLTAVALIELWVLPLYRRTYATWVELYNRASRELAAHEDQRADSTAQAAYAAAQRIRWRGQEARAASALMWAQTRLKLGYTAEAERLASQAIPEFEQSKQILGITPDAGYRIRGKARLETGNLAGAAEDLRTAARLRAAWAGEDQVVAQILFAEGMALGQLGRFDQAEQRLSEALRITDDPALRAMIHASLGSGLDSREPGTGQEYLRAAADHYVRDEGESLSAQPRIAYLVLTQLSRDDRFDDAIRLCDRLWQTTAAGKEWLLLARGQLLLNAGLYRSAEQAARRAATAVASEQTGIGMVSALLLEAQTALAQQKWDEARALAERADEMLAHQSHPIAEANRATVKMVLDRTLTREVDPEWIMTPEREERDARMMLP